MSSNPPADSPATQKTGDPDAPVKIVPILSRRPRRKALIPSAVRKLTAKFNGKADEPEESPTNETTAQPSRFRTNEHPGNTPAAQRQFLQDYQTAYAAIEAADYPAALTKLNELMIDASPEHLAECHGLRGYLYLKMLNFERSEADCSTSIGLKPGDPQTYSWRAAARGEQDQWRLAFDDLLKACDLAGSNDEQYRNLMLGYMETAKEHFRQLISSGQHTARIFFERGWMYRCLGNRQKSERDFRQALTLDPQHAWASAGLALLETNLTENDKTLEPTELDSLCQNALEGDTDCQRIALTVRARLHHQRVELQEAANCLSQLQAMAGSDPALVTANARLQLQLGDPVNAIDLLNELLKQHPHHYAAWLLRADCYFAIANDAQAVDDYTEYMSSFPTDTTALIQRARAELRRGHADLAMDDVDHALNIDKTLFDAWLFRSRISLTAGKLDQAMTDCQRAMRLDNQQAELYAVLGEIYHQLGDLTRAAEEYGRSIQYAASPEDQARYLYQRGIEWYEMADFEKANEDFSRSLELRPDHAGTLVWRAATNSRQEHLAAAIVDLQHAIEIRPAAAAQYFQLGQPLVKKAVGFFNRQQQRGKTGADVFFNRGRAFQFLGQDEDSIRDFSSALELDPDQVEAKLCRGQVFTRQGDHAAACDDFSSIIEVKPDSDWAWYCRAKAQFQRRSFSDALADINQAIKLSPRRAHYYLLSSEIAAEMGSRRLQAKALDQAILYDSTNPASYVRRARLREDAGQVEQAVQDLTRALELDPSQINMLCWRGRLYLATNRGELAEQDFSQALTFDPLRTEAWAGRAQALAVDSLHQESLICLTKAMHRFSDSNALGQILMSRGKIFQQMGRLAPAIADYSSAIELLSSDSPEQPQAIFERAVACGQLNENQQSIADFECLVRRDWKEPVTIQTALAWLNGRAETRPDLLQPPKDMIRPTRPPVVSQSLAHWLPKTSWESQPPHDQWIVRLGPQKEYGPVRYDILLGWLREGRVAADSKLLRSDWASWRKAEKLFPDAFANSPGNAFDVMPVIKEVFNDR